MSGYEAYGDYDNFSSDGETTPWRPIESAPFDDWFDDGGIDQKQPPTPLNGHQSSIHRSASTPRDYLELKYNRTVDRKLTLTALGPQDDGEFRVLVGGVHIPDPMEGVPASQEQQNDADKSDRGPGGDMTFWNQWALHCTAVKDVSFDNIKFEEVRKPPFRQDRRKEEGHHRVLQIWDAKKKVTCMIDIPKSFKQYYRPRKYMTRPLPRVDGLKSDEIVLEIKKVYLPAEMKPWVYDSSTPADSRRIQKEEKERREKMKAANLMRTEVERALRKRRKQRMIESEVLLARAEGEELDESYFDDISDWGGDYERLWRSDPEDDSLPEKDREAFSEDF